MCLQYYNDSNTNMTFSRLGQSECDKFLRQSMSQKSNITALVFRLDALAKALSVIATATWLGGWLGVRHTPVLYQNG